MTQSEYDALSPELRAIADRGSKYRELDPMLAVLRAQSVAQGVGAEGMELWAKYEELRARVRRG